MTRSTFDESKPEDGRDYSEKRLPCNWCAAPTLIETLNHFGARCSRCYEAYCSERQPTPEWMSDKRVGGPKAWAEALRKVEQSCGRLTIAQRTMWRSALANESRSEAA